MILSRNLQTFYAAFFITLVSASTSWAQTSEVERLSGFAQHQKNYEQFDKAREKGERAFLEEEEQWENQRKRDLQIYKREKKSQFVSEDGPEAKADALAKKQYEIFIEKERKAYAERKSKQKEVRREAENLPSEMQELGLADNRPRYDYRKRSLYGAPSKYGKLQGGSGSSGGGSFGGGSGSSGTSFPPPPTFDDFGDGGYVPAPNMSDDFGDVPPPPPPPPPGFGDDSGGFGSGEFIPPPPPPPSFGEDGGDF